MILNTLQIGLGSLTPTHSSSPALNLKTQNSSNSFEDRLSEAFAHSIQRNGATQTDAGPRLSHAVTARQGFAAIRRDLATSNLSNAVMTALTNSPASSSTTAASASTAATPSTAATASATGATSATATGSTSGSASPIVDGLTPFLGYNAAPKDTSGTTETPAQIVADLLAQNAPPTPYGAMGQPSTDPSVFMSGSYQRDLNLNWYLQVANHDNAYRYQTYSDAVQRWATDNNMQGNPPTPPKYESVDVSGFDSWWQQYCGNPGQDAPPVNFLVNGSSVQGQYGWTSPA